MNLLRGSMMSTLKLGWVTTTGEIKRKKRKNTFAAGGGWGRMGSGLVKSMYIFGGGFETEGQHLARNNEMKAIEEE